MSDIEFEFGITDENPVGDLFPSYREVEGTDPTEAIRREMISTGQPAADLEATEGPTWTTEQLREEFEVLGFAAPFVVVERKSDGVKGSLEFTHGPPRLYFNWSAD